MEKYFNRQPGPNRWFNIQSDDGIERCLCFTGDVKDLQKYYTFVEFKDTTTVVPTLKIKD